MRRRVLRVVFGPASHDCIVGGPGAGELLFGITGRRHVYSAERRGYSVQERTARNAIAAAERLSYDIEIVGPRAAPVVALPAEPEPLPDAEVSLW